MHHKACQFVITSTKQYIVLIFYTVFICQFATIYYLCKTKLKIQQNEYNNKDIIGYLIVPGTSISEPVLQGSDNSFYLSHGIDKKKILISKIKMLEKQKEDIETRLSIINHILENDEMSYQVTVKEIPETIVCYSEVKVKKYSDMMKIIPSLKKEFLELNPQIKCTKPPYEFCEYLDKEHKETDIMIRHHEAIKSIGMESDRIKFKKIPATKVLSLFYKGAYDEIGKAYSFLMKYVEENDYNDLFGDIDYDFDEMSTYKINSFALTNIEAYRSI